MSLLLVVIGADGCLVVMADTHLVSRAAHLQTGVLGGIWTYGEGSGLNVISERSKNKLVETEQEIQHNVEVVKVES